MVTKTLLVTARPRGAVHDIVAAYGKAEDFGCKDQCAVEKMVWMAVEAQCEEGIAQREAMRQQRWPVELKV